jgi:hypothetical protein
LLDPHRPLNVNAGERARLGGVGYMWKDIMQKHNEIGGFHAGFVSTGDEKLVASAA